MVGDSPAWSKTRGCLQALGILERLEKLGVEIVNLDQPERMTIENTPVGLSRIALEAGIGGVQPVEALLPEPFAGLAGEILDLLAHHEPPYSAAQVKLAEAADTVMGV